MADQQNNSQPATPEEVSELTKVEAQRDEYLNAWKRAAADFINYKKDEGKRFEQMAAYATADFVKDFLPVLDSFELGMSAVEKDGAAYKGMLMIRGQMQDALRKKGIERIVVKRGDDFNPEFHEAMMEVEIPPNDPDREKLSGKILEELVPGYSLNGRTIRATKVKLGK
jgi:molecular chaperone GrpE